MPQSYSGLVFLGLPIVASAIAVGIVACDPGASTGVADNPVTPTGCSGTRPPTAPDGYYVNGNTVCSPDGKPHLFHGVDRPSMEWDQEGQYMSAADFALMGSWHANTVRIALNQDFWLSASPSYFPGYAAQVDKVVQWAHAAGMDVILDLHWSDQGNYSVTPAQQPMADQHSIEFWKEVATRYKDDGRVFFELYNEPHDVPVDVWLSGGVGGQALYQAAGMQQLHDAVRGVGAENLVIVGGLNYAFDLSHVANSPVQGHNILYATHPYNNASSRQPADWYGAWGYLTKTAPVVVTEFGDGTSTCSPVYDTELIAYADQHNTSWTAWAWWAGGGCTFPSLITDWKANTTNEGGVVKAALLGYNDPAAPVPGDGGPDGASQAGDDAGTTDDAGTGGSTGTGGTGGGDSGDAGPQDADTSG